MKPQEQPCRAALFSGALATGVTWLQDAVVGTFGWLYVLLVALFLVFVLALLFTPYGGIKPGREVRAPLPWAAAPL